MAEEGSSVLCNLSMFGQKTSVFARAPVLYFGSLKIRMSCEEIAKILFGDDDTTRSWFRVFAEDGIDGLPGFGHDGSQLAAHNEDASLQR